MTKEMVLYKQRMGRPVIAVGCKQMSPLKKDCILTYYY